MVVARVVGPLLVLMIAVGFYAWVARHVHFVCPRCGASFKVANLALMFTIHVGLAAFVVCPRCGYRAMMRPMRD